MREKVLLLLLGCSGVYGQESDSEEWERMGVMAVILAVILAGIFMVFMTAISYVYFRRYANAMAEFLPGRRGIHPSIIESFPTVFYSGDIRIRNGGQCVVCLDDFEDGEMLRLLPRCHHLFHPRCIDRWLRSHTSCPFCRAVQTR